MPPRHNLTKEAPPTGASLPLPIETPAQPEPAIAEAKLSAELPLPPVVEVDTSAHREEQAAFRAEREAHEHAREEAFFERLSATLTERFAATNAPGAFVAAKDPHVERAYTDEDLTGVAAKITDKDLERLLELRGNTADLARWAVHGVAPGTHWIPIDTVHCIVNGKIGKLYPGVPVPVDHLSPEMTDSLRKKGVLLAPGEPTPRGVKLPVHAPTRSPHAFS